MNLLDIRNMMSYTEWANELAMAAAAQLPEESLHRDFGISHKSICPRCIVAWLAT